MREGRCSAVPAARHQRIEDMKTSRPCPALSALASVFLAVCHAHAGEIFSDDFDDNAPDPVDWLTWGTSVTEADQILKVLQNKTDAGGNAETRPIPISSVGSIVIRRDVRLHHENEYFMGSMHLNFGDLPRVGIKYGHIAYDGAYGQPVFGFYVTRNNTNPHSPDADPANISTRVEPLWDTWFSETVIYNPQTGELRYLINGDLKTTLNVGVMPNSEDPRLTIRFDSWGWWTGHQHLIDDLSVSQDLVQIREIPEHEHNPLDGREAIKDFQMTTDGTCKFTFSTNDVGALCLVSWSQDLKRWFPLIQFQTQGEGTEVEDFPREPKKLYKATYLPTGATAAQSFGYPVGSGVLAEQIDPEYPNNLYPEGPEGTVERPLLGQPINSSAWYNAQDVGSYLMTSKGPGYHPGEDWNIGGDADGDGVGDDVGELVVAVADGVIRDISPLNNSSNGGWAIVVQHHLLNGDQLESIYAHVAPPTLADHSTPNSGGLIGEESWFPLQEGTPVSKGDVIAVVGNVDAYPDHLHFEIRKRPIANLPVPAGSAAISFYWPRSMGNAYYATFAAMEQEGIVDPSDFIDEHQ